MPRSTVCDQNENKKLRKAKTNNYWTEDGNEEMSQVIHSFHPFVSMELTIRVGL